MQSAALTNAGGGCGDDGSGSRGGGGGDLTAFCARTPRRMFLCDAPFFLKEIIDATTGGSGDDHAIARLMGTVVEIMRTSPVEDASSGQTNSEASPSNRNVVTNDAPMTYFVIDDGTATIGVFAKRRQWGGSDGERLNHATTSCQNGKFNALHKAETQNPHRQPPNQFTSAGTLELVLSSSQPPILVGQTVDCIGRVQLGTDEKKFGTTNNGENIPGIWLAASSVSIVNNPQEVTLRQIELSSSNRLRRNNGRSNRIDKRAEIGYQPKNRILVSGLERKLNPLYHEDHKGAVSFNMEEAFNYIKFSKDDGGITPKELAVLVGALEPDDILAVNLTVEQLREDCRIYLNQGKWFPM